MSLSKPVKPDLRPKGGSNEFQEKIIGKPIDGIPHSTLPQTRMVYRRIRELKKQKGLTNEDITETLYTEITDIWNKAALQYVRKDHVKEKVKSLIEDLRNILRSWKRYSVEKDPLKSFVENLDTLFDIAPENLYDLCKNSYKTNPYWREDWDFYIGMKENPNNNWNLGSRDVRWAERQERIAERRMAEERREHSSASEESQPEPMKWKNRWAEVEHSPLPSSSTLAVGNHELRKRKNSNPDSPDSVEHTHEEVTDVIEVVQSESSTAFKRKKKTDQDEDPDYKPTRRVENDLNKKPTHQQLNVNTRDLINQTTPVATRYHLSSTQHLAMMASFVDCSGGDINDFVLSSTSVKRKRKEEQESLADDIRDDFKEKYAGWPKFVQWDGKCMVLLEGNDRVFQEVNAVVLSVPGSGEKPKVIGLPTVDRGTGRNLATSCLNKCWEYTDIADIRGGVCDTTSANMGIHEGAMAHIERDLNNKQIWIGCKHHTDELIITHVYSEVMHPTTGPDDPLFKDFKQWWTEMKGK